MNTTIIIGLGVLILIVVVAIIVILIKSKDPEEVDSSESTAFGKSFQEETPNPSQEPELTSPKLHEKEVESPPVAESKPPVMNNLASPQQTPPAQSSTTPMHEERPTVQEVMNQPTPDSQQATTQNRNIYKSNPLPDESKISSDMQNLQKSMQRPVAQKVNKATTPMEAPTVAQPSQKDELDSITNDISNVLQSEATVNQSTPVSQPNTQPNDGIKVIDDLENKMPQSQKTEDVRTTPPIQQGQTLPNSTQFNAPQSQKQDDSSAVPPIPPMQQGQALPNSTQFNAPQSQKQDDSSAVPPIPPIQQGQALPDSTQPNTPPQPNSNI